jgi:hypothetical protein
MHEVEASLEARAVFAGYEALKRRVEHYGEPLVCGVEPDRNGNDVVASQGLHPRSACRWMLIYRCGATSGMDCLRPVL